MALSLSVCSNSDLGFPQFKRWGFFFSSIIDHPVADIGIFRLSVDDGLSIPGPKR
jgi:hypothetical protein